MRELGTTGLRVSPVGLGAGSLDGLDETEAARLLHGAVDLGVTYLDTARSYGTSEARIGRHLGHRRADVVLSTKVGYGIDGVRDWTGEAVRRGIDDALQTLRTDWLDVVHLHSCPRDVLVHTDVVEALDRAVAAGKVRVAAYAGDGDPVWQAVEDRRLTVLTTSASLFDQASMGEPLHAAKQAGMGVVAKRPLANAPWRHTVRPHDVEWVTYWDRMQAMALTPRRSWVELAIRYVVWTWGIDTAIVGTRRLAHLEQAVVAASRGKLPEDEIDEVRSAFWQHGWPGHV